MMEKKLTPKQQRILQFIESYWQRSRVSPSLRDIGDYFGIAPGTVQDQVRAIEKKGFLKRNEAQARGLHVASPPAQIPILGRVYAGQLHAAFENVEGHIPPSAKQRSVDHFALRVRGDSMIGAGIVENDLVLVRKQAEANDGDIVVAMVEDEATVKFFRKKGTTVYLEAANPKYKPIKNPDLLIIGKVVEVRRQYE